MERTGTVREPSVPEIVFFFCTAAFGFVWLCVISVGVIAGGSALGNPSHAPNVRSIDFGTVWIATPLVVVGTIGTIAFSIGDTIHHRASRIGWIITVLTLAAFGLSCWLLIATS